MGHLERKIDGVVIFRVAGGTGRSARGSSFGKRNKTKTDRIQHARHPCDESTGGGGSKTPTANHRRPLPFLEAPMWPKVGPELAQTIRLCVPGVVVESLRGTHGPIAWPRSEPPFGHVGVSRKAGGGGDSPQASSPKKPGTGTQTVGAGRFETLGVRNRLKIGPRSPPGVQTHPFFALRSAVATRGPPEGQLSVSQTALR